MNARTSRVFLAVLLAVSLSHCKQSDSANEFGPLVLFALTSFTCTGIGCIGGIHVKYTPALGTASYQAALVLDGVSASFTCNEETPENKVGEFYVTLCDAELFWISATPSSLTVTVTPADGSGQRSGSFTPTYERFYPNGPQCDSGCTSASVEL